MDKEDKIDKLHEKNTIQKCFNSLVTHKVENFVLHAPKSGAFLKMATLWLKHSFGDVMEGVWNEFPQNKISTFSTNSGPIDVIIPNYLALNH